MGTIFGGASLRPSGAALNPFKLRIAPGAEGVDPPLPCAEDETYRFQQFDLIAGRRLIILIGLGEGRAPVSRHEVGNPASYTQAALECDAPLLNFDPGNRVETDCRSSSTSRANKEKVNAHVIARPDNHRIFSMFHPSQLRAAAMRWLC